MSGGDWKEMFNAGCEGNLELVKYHVQAGVDVNFAHPEFLSTPLVRPFWPSKKKSRFTCWTMAQQRICPRSSMA
jgi:hypothetical protein